MRMRNTSYKAHKWENTIITPPHRQPAFGIHSISCQKHFHSFIWRKGNDFSLDSLDYFYNMNVSSAISILLNSILFFVLLLLLLPLRWWCRLDCWWLLRSHWCNDCDEIECTYNSSITKTMHNWSSWINWI